MRKREEIVIARRGSSVSRIGYWAEHLGEEEKKRYLDWRGVKILVDGIS